MKIITKTEKQTFNFACKFAKELKGGEVITLKGDLGAGKTVFTKGLAKGLGLKKTVTSPTFVVMKNYRIKNQKSRIKELVHIDAYRLNFGADLEAIGALEYFRRNDCVVVIEWPLKIKTVLPQNVIKITIDIEKEKRQIKIKIPR